MKSTKLPLRFVVLIEWRLHAALALLLMLAALLWPARAQAAPRDKVAADLRQAVDSAATPRQRWHQELAGRRYVHTLVVSDGRDAGQVELRRAVVAAGGTVHWRYQSLPALFVTLPVDKVDGTARVSPSPCWIRASPGTTPRSPMASARGLHAPSTLRR
ncbi:MAG: hypothetical protein JF617_06795 [Burkholderiales bacterium]|nr:hypothetical protein [Burkholderiales bacterium]